MRNRKRSNLILILVFCVGLSLLLYPVLSDYWNSFHQTQAVVDYDVEVSEMKKEDFSKYFKDAKEYNKKLAATPFPLEDYKVVPGYEKALDIGQNGIMGYITIKKLDVMLPIYHGTSDSVLNVAVGHLEGTSLPIGGKGTHSVLSAHRGLPSAKLFTRLDEMAEGDVFTLKVLDRVLTYEVDQVLIVEPDQIDDLMIDPEKDYCTLMTCTPYGINTHRLLVRGHRVKNAENIDAMLSGDALQVDKTIVAPLVAAPILIILLVAVLIATAKKTRRGKYAQTHKKTRN